LVAHNVAVGTGLQIGLTDLVSGSKIFRGLAVVPTGFKRKPVGLNDFFFASELCFDETQGGFYIPTVQPKHQAHGKEIFAAIGNFRTQFQFRDGISSHRGHGDQNHAVAIDRAIFQWAGFQLG